mmetsp:Transcript_8772/g.32155  ORF Transcript_8772/g.32155 Transcript_8772/m.32155 type:complete len:354 (+) Transcript_8772:1148-2209(+)
MKKAIEKAETAAKKALHDARSDAAAEMEVAKSAAADALDAANAKLSDATERAHWLESKLVEDAATDESKKREDDAAEGALKREIERLTEENKRMEGECATLRENIRAESKMMSDNAIKLGKELLDAKKRLGAVAGELDNVKKVKEEIAAMFEEKSNEASATAERLRASEEKCEYFSKELASAISQSQEIREELMRSKAAAAEAAAESEEKTRAGVGAGEKTDDDATSTAAAAAAAGRSSRALIALLAPQRLLLHPSSLLLAVFAQLLFLLDARGLGLFRLLTQRLLPFLIERGVGFFPLSRLGRFPGRQRRLLGRVEVQQRRVRDARVRHRRPGRGLRAELLVRAEREREVRR